MSVISLANYAGNSRLPDCIMRSLVTRSTDNVALFDSGEIRGGTLALYCEDNPVVFKANMGVRKIWAEAVRTLNLSFEGYVSLKQIC